MTGNAWIIIGAVCAAIAVVAIPYGFHLKSKESSQSSVQIAGDSVAGSKVSGGGDYVAGDKTININTSVDEHRVRDTKSQFQPADSQLKKLVFPTFSEDTKDVIFSLGEGGISSGYSRDALAETPREPFYFSGYRPVKLYIEGNQLYADVTIYGGSGFPPIQILHNKLINKPPDWDFNSNKMALEIVNDKGVPIYQFYYKTASHIVMNGIFPFPGGLILANESGTVMNPRLPATFELKLIFKYPSWKYPGEYLNN